MDTYVLPSPSASGFTLDERRRRRCSGGPTVKTLLSTHFTPPTSGTTHLPRHRPHLRVSPIKEPPPAGCRRAADADEMLHQAQDGCHRYHEVQDQQSTTGDIDGRLERSVHTRMTSWLISRWTIITSAISIEHYVGEESGKTKEIYIRSPVREKRWPSTGESCSHVAL